MFYENDWDPQGLFNVAEDSPTCFASFSSLPSDHYPNDQDFEKQSPFEGFQDDGSPTDDQDQQQQHQGYKGFEEGGLSSTSSSSGWPSFEEPQSNSTEEQRHPFYDEPSCYVLDPRTVYIPPAHLFSSPDRHRQSSYRGASEEDSNGEYMEGMSDDGGGRGGASSEIDGDTEMERRERRKATNRASAKAFRLRRKILLKEQQQSLDERDAELSRLREEAELLRYDNDLLRSVNPGEDTIYEEEE